jgi:DNA repair exonuclease SbcCD ATPase subunit
MSLSQILAALGSGQVQNLVNVLQSIVHTVIEEIEQLRSDHDSKQAQLLEAVNKLDDRTGQTIAGTCDQLTAKMGTAVQDLSKRMVLLDQKVLSELEANVTATVEDIGALEDKLGQRLNELEATLRTHVERIERQIAWLIRGVPACGKLEGYEGESKE